MDNNSDTNTEDDEYTNSSTISPEAQARLLRQSHGDWWTDAPTAAKVYIVAVTVACLPIAVAGYAAQEACRFIGSRLFK